MDFSAEQIEFFIQIITLIGIPLLMFVLRQHDQRNEARINLLREQLMQRVELMGYQTDDLKQYVERLEKHHQEQQGWLDKLSERQHQLELEIARNYTTKADVAVTVQSLGNKLDRNHDSIMNIREQLKLHEAALTTEQAT